MGVVIMETEFNPVRTNEFEPGSNQPINKTMDRKDLFLDEARPVVEHLNDVVTRLKREGLKVSSWYGKFDLPQDESSTERINRGVDYEPLEGAADDANFPWFLYWEITWVVINNRFAPGQKVLDLGGSSSLFSYFLADLGLDVTTVDIQAPLVQNANYVAERMGWNLRNYVMDMRALDFSEEFDHVTSLCVYEHVPMYDRIKINRRLDPLLKAGGKFSITFDYRNPCRLARIDTPEDVDHQFVRTSGLTTRGNQSFFDNRKNYLLNPFYSKQVSIALKAYKVFRGEHRLRELFKVKSDNDYTFGALFLEKTAAA